MPAPPLGSLLKLLGTPRDSALLRFSLGSEYLKAGDPASAATHLREAVTRDPDYSAAWKLLGRALAESGAAEGRSTPTSGGSPWPKRAATSRRRRR